MSDTSGDAAPPLRLRVFLASPGDVQDERALALRVLERLPYDPFLRGRLVLDVVVWDKPGADTPMLATLTPEEAIAQQRPKPSECDVVVVIFWSRMGTPLPKEYVKDDGVTRYLSGTEWEYLDAVRAAEERSIPPTVQVICPCGQITHYHYSHDYHVRERCSVTSAARFSRLTRRRAG